MNIKLDSKIALQYKNNSQKIRVLTESWVDKQVFCPACGCSVKNYENNRPVADFFCPNCAEEYELKSKSNTIGLKIADGAYSKMIERLASSNNPNFFLLNYSSDNYEILDFLVIPKHFFTADIIEKRKALSPTARRAGWIGCNISLAHIPQNGKIFYIKNKKIQPKDLVLENWHKTLFLREAKMSGDRGWLLDIMICIDRLGALEFSLQEIYSFEHELSKKYPDNKHIKDKIRQQLQILRDKKYLTFIGRGKYKLL